MTADLTALRDDELLTALTQVALARETAFYACARHWSANASGGRFQLRLRRAEAFDRYFPARASYDVAVDRYSAITNELHRRLVRAAA